MRAVLLGLFVVAAVAALAATPISSGWVTRPFACDVGPSFDWPATIVNVRHLASFGVLAAVGFLAFNSRPVWAIILLLFAITAAVELEEAIFASGHCRARDLIPNVLAIGLGWAVALLLRRLLPALR